MYEAPAATSTVRSTNGDQWHNLDIQPTDRGLSLMDPDQWFVSWPEINKSIKRLLEKVLVSICNTRLCLACLVSGIDDLQQCFANKFSTRELGESKNLERLGIHEDCLEKQ